MLQGLVIAGQTGGWLWVCLQFSGTNGKEKNKTKHLLVAVLLHSLLTDLGLLPELIGRPPRKTLPLIRSRKWFPHTWQTGRLKILEQEQTGEIGPSGTFPIVVPVIKSLHFPNTFTYRQLDSLGPRGWKPSWLCK